jgi:tripartite-type tricarboxylate transporter receptor subunit TctC
MFSAEVEQRATAQGFKVTAKGTAEFDAFLKTEISRWSRLIKKAKITAT